MSKKAVFFDIDGTLINIWAGKTKMSSAVHQAIRELRAAGHHTFIASGRPLTYLDPELRDPSLFDGYVLLNGAAVVVNDKLIFQRSMPKAQVLKAMELADKEGVEYALQTYPHTYMNASYHMMVENYNKLGIPPTSFVYEFDKEQVAGKVAKMEFMSKTPNANGLFEKLLGWPGITGLIDPTRRIFMEIYASDISKATGIQEALKYLGIPVEDSFAFGDGFNDMEMMRVVGTPLVMGNAGPELKALAKYVLPSVNDDGVAYGIYHYIFKNQ